MFIVTDETLNFQNKGVPKERWLPDKLWHEVLMTMPIACVDVIFQREDKSILYGWRLIRPYANVWALLGGRILRGEDLYHCAARIAKEYRLRFEELYLNGVFPVRFTSRSDIVVSLAARKLSGKPRVDGVEFSKFVWTRVPPKRLGTNYVRMVTHWKRASRSVSFRQLSLLP